MNYRTARVNSNKINSILTDDWSILVVMTVHMVGAGRGVRFMYELTLAVR
jgi:hypothetical protein